MKAEYNKEQDKLIIIPETSDESEILRSFTSPIHSFEHFQGLIIEKESRKVLVKYWDDLTIPTKKLIKQSHYEITDNRGHKTSFNLNNIEEFYDITVKTKIKEFILKNLKL